MERRGESHMSPSEISAYLSRSLAPDRREAVARHLVTCDECRSDLITASEALEHAGRRRWAILLLPTAAAAAVVLLFFAQSGGPGVSGVPTTPIRSDSAEGVQTFAAIFPQEGARVVADSVRFEWRSEGAGARYRLTVTDEIGDVAWEESTSDTLLVPTRELALVPGARYFWRVDALLSGARSSTTGFRSFVVVAR